VKIFFICGVTCGVIPHAIHLHAIRWQSSTPLDTPCHTHTKGWQPPPPPPPSFSITICHKTNVSNSGQKQCLESYRSTLGLNSESIVNARIKSKETTFTGWQQSQKRGFHREKGKQLGYVLAGRRHDGRSVSGTSQLTTTPSESPSKTLASLLELLDNIVNKRNHERFKSFNRFQSA
jgi:hypothetical protein